MRTNGSKGNQQAEWEPFNAVMHAEVTKVNEWRNWGEKTFFSKKKKVSEKKFFSSEIFFSLNFMSFWTQVEAGRKPMPTLHPE